MSSAELGGSTFLLNLVSDVGSLYESRVVGNQEDVHLHPFAKQLDEPAHVVHVVLVKRREALIQKQQWS